MTTGAPVLDTDGSPATTAALVRDVWCHRDVLRALARTDFQVRYKRAVFGVAWAVLLPLVQAVVLAVVFSRVLAVGSSRDFTAFVLAGVMPWGYFALTVGTASTAIVEGSGLTDKVWFPRALLPLAPALANVVGLAVSVVVLLAALVVLGVTPGAEVLWLLPGTLLLFAFTVSLSLVLAALHVYFRDVRFITQAALLVWFYATPVLYPPSFLRGLEDWVRYNPMTGVVELFHAATVGAGDSWLVAVAVSTGTTVALAAAALAVYRRHDRLFVDQL